MLPTRLGFLLVCALGALPATAQAPLSSLSEAEVALGQKLFIVHCARCHGIDGRGGEGSNLARAKLRYAPNDQALIDLIGAGIPGTGMPATLPRERDMRVLLAGYVRTLSKLAEPEMPGDPVRGREIYRNTAGCPTCHIVAGEGRGFGPELTDVGDRRGLAYLRESMVAPAAAQSQTLGYRDFLTVRAVTPQGTIEGIRVNEDDFSIQIRDVAGTLHSFRKDKLLRLEKVVSHSLMPQYATAISERDLDDLVSYLMSLRSSP